MATVTKTKKYSLNRYGGQWVALISNKVVAHHETLKGLMKIVDGEGLRDKAVVFLVPRKDEGPYVL